MADVELIGVPFDGWGRLGHNEALAARVLCDAGVVEVFGAHPVVLGDDLVLLSGPGAGRGLRISLVDEAALFAMVGALGVTCSGAVAGGRFCFRWSMAV
ncbi:MAG: arginase family protein, partial [Streptosporangiales bacterium]|nr:arginase family protein [Streptosporangiales bacterium]